jgi:lipoprotein-releasing system permease protein
MSKLELSIAWRYLRSRRGSKLLSLISLIAIGGVTIAVSALIVIIGVMNGLQTDLREKLLIGSPDIRVMMYGRNLVMPDWQPVRETVARQAGVVAVGPFVQTRALVQASGQTYMDAGQVEGLPPDGPGVPQVTTIRQHGTVGDFSFKTPDGQHRGAVLGSKLAKRLMSHRASIRSF